MGCQCSCLKSPSKRSDNRENNDSPSTDPNGGAAEVSERAAEELQTRRMHFIRSGSSSNSSHISGAKFLSSLKRKRKNKKRPYQLSSQSASNAVDGTELSKSILGDAPEVVDIADALEKLLKEEEAEQQVKIQPPSAIPLSPGLHNARATVTRMFSRRNPLKNDDQSEASQTDDHVPLNATHRRQTSNENYFPWLPSSASLTAGLGGHKRQTSMDINLAKADVPAAQHLGQTNSSGNSLVSPTGISVAQPPTSGGQHHRRQNSESKMFARMVRVSSLAAVSDAESSHSVTQVPSACSTKAFRLFLEKVNKDTVTDEELENWRSRVHGINKEEKWTASHMQDYLYSAQNQAKDVRVLGESMDLTRPLSEYFTSTSHNTYLFGGQWAATGGKVDLQMYSRALRQGCRCVEIDLYDGPDGDPIVTHVSPGWSGGSVTFLEVCALIAKEGFKESLGSSPLILNLENNLNKQSKRAAEILIGSFGSRIVRADDPVFGWDKNGLIQVCPSPADLAGRVLCRSKPRDSSEEYQNLIYLRNSPWRFGNVEEFMRRKFYQTSSLSESKVKGALKKVAADVAPIELNRVFINRVYPRATAYSSQNYNPLPYWLLGFQLVALNFQTEGVDMDVNRCMFERNNGLGFVLKPVLMRRAMRGTQTRMNGGVRMSRNPLLSASSKGLLLPRSVISNGGEPSPSSGGLLRGGSSLFSSNSSRFNSRPFSDPSRGPTAETAPSGNTPVAGSSSSAEGGNHQQTLSRLRKNENSKSFMGVVEEALKNQNEDEEEDANEDDEDLPSPPPLSTTSGGEGSKRKQSGSGTFFPPVPPSVMEERLAKKRLSPRRSQLMRTMSTQSSCPELRTTDSPDSVVRTLQDSDIESSAKVSQEDNNSPSTALVQKSEAEVLSEEEKKKRFRTRRRSTGSILKLNVDPGEGPVVSSRKRSLEEPATSSASPLMLAQSPSVSHLMIEEEPIEEKMALNSVLIRFISVRCNVSRERINTFGSYISVATEGATSSGGGDAVTNSGGGEMSSTQGGPKTSTEIFDSINGNGFPDEEVLIELSVDGHPLDRVEKRTVGTVQLKGTQPTEFDYPEEVAAMLKDSETALFTIKLIDAWGGGGGNSILASRTFFAHSLQPGTRDLILLGESSHAGYPIPYTVRCNISTMYSIFSKTTGKFELEDRLELPILPCPSKVAMIHCVVVACRSETSKLKLGAIDPFIGVQVIGVPSDSKEVRTPKVSKCAKGKMLVLPKHSAGMGGTSQKGGGGTSASAGTLDSNSQASSSSSTLPDSGSGGGVEGANECHWMFPLVMTFAWSEFAFLRFTLRSHSNVDMETGVILNSVSSNGTRRRGSLVPYKPTPTHGMKDASGMMVNGTASGLESGFALGKNMLWADAIRPGYRSIPLYLEKNPETHVATLLCHFTVFNAQDQTFGQNLDEPPPIIQNPADLSIDLSKVNAAKS